jgi:methoxymalonate biosynthesis acyl carrier protein
MEKVPSNLLIEVYRMDEMKAKIRTFISRFFRKHELSYDEDIFALGFVNSFFAVQLVTFLEKEFAVKIDNKDFDFANFRTINTIADLVTRKSAGNE